MAGSFALEEAVDALRRAAPLDYEKLVSALQAMLAEEMTNHIYASPDQHPVNQGRTRCLRELVARIENASTKLASRKNP